MTDQGEQETGHRDWWAELYDPRAPDTGRTRAADSIEDRYDSVTRTLTGSPVPAPRPGSGTEPGPGPEARPGSGPRSSAPARDPAPTGAGPAVLPRVGPVSLGELVPDSVAEGTECGGMTLRAGSVRGAASRREGVLRGDALLVARFGEREDGMVLVAVATGAPGGGGAHRAARAACQAIGAAVGRGGARLAQDVHAGRTSALGPGLHRLTDHTRGTLRAQAAALGLEPGQYAADLRCLLLPVDPRCRHRVFFGSGAGGLFRLRDGTWSDIEPRGTLAPPAAGPPEPGRGRTAGAAPARDGFAVPEPDPAARTEPFRFTVCAAEPGDILLLCGAGLAEPLRADPSFADRLAARWADPPALAGYPATLEDGAGEHEADRTAATVWEARGTAG